MKRLLKMGYGRAAAILLALSASCFGQTDFAGLMPGQSTKSETQQLLGQPVKMISQTLMEYSPQGLSGRIFIQYRDDGVIERIELVCKHELSNCGYTLMGMKLRLPATESAAKYDGDKWRLLYGSPLFIGTAGSLAEETDGPTPSRIILYSRELFDAEIEEVVEKNKSDYVKGGSLFFRAGILNGKAIKKPEAAYPAAAKAVRASGTVKVAVSTDETGRIVGVQAFEAHQLLRMAAEAAAEKAQVSPTIIGGKAVKVVGTLTYSFRLD